MSLLGWGCSSVIQHLPTWVQNPGFIPNTAKKKKSHSFEKLQFWQLQKKDIQVIAKGRVPINFHSMISKS
jgi:hypothetical protein